MFFPIIIPWFIREPDEDSIFDGDPIPAPDGTSPWAMYAFSRTHIISLLVVALHFIASGLFVFTDVFGAYGYDMVAREFIRPPLWMSIVFSYALFPVTVVEIVFSFMCLCTDPPEKGKGIR